MVMYLNVNKIEVVACFSELLCHFLLVCIEVCMSRVPDKTDKFLLNYSNLSWDPVFIVDDRWLCWLNTTVFSDSVTC